MDTDFVFGETNTNTAFTCEECSPEITLSVSQVHILINALSNSTFDRALLDYEQGELDLLMGILMIALETNQ